MTLDDGGRPRIRHGRQGLEADSLLPMLRMGVEVDTGDHAERRTLVGGSRAAHERTPSRRARRSDRHGEHRRLGVVLHVRVGREHESGLARCIGAGEQHQHPAAVGAGFPSPCTTGAELVVGARDAAFRLRLEILRGLGHVGVRRHLVVAAADGVANRRVDGLRVERRGVERVEPHHVEDDRRELVAGDRLVADRHDAVADRDGRSGPALGRRIRLGVLGVVVLHLGRVGRHLRAAVVDDVVHGHTLLKESVGTSTDSTPGGSC